PKEGQGYGKKLLGKNHSRIEGPYILYHPGTEYYYLFLSFGGLGAYDGYNIRVARSKSPDGPYADASGQDMINCGGRDGSFFQDADIV
ncbi:family 43 glycosylhydrolase, partial [Escherichia coli]